MKQFIIYAFMLLSGAPDWGAAPENTVAVLSMKGGAYLGAFSAFPASTSALLMKPTRISSFAPHVLQVNHACGYLDTEIGRRRRA